MPPAFQTDDIRVPLDDASRARLRRLSRATGKVPALLAAELLQQMLEEDELFNDDKREHGNG